MDSVMYYFFTDANVELFTSSLKRCTRPLRPLSVIILLSPRRLHYHVATCAIISNANVDAPPPPALPIKSVTLIALLVMRSVRPLLSSCSLSPRGRLACSRLVVCVTPPRC